MVAEPFGKTTQFETPKVESTSSGGGLKLFCAGVGVEHPDITNASRRTKQSEQELCANNGVKDIIEVKVGDDGIVPGQSKATKPLTLTRKDIFLARAFRNTNGWELEKLLRGSLRRLATYLMEDPRNIRWVIDCAFGIKAMERIGDHAGSIARNIVYSVTGKDVRHVSMANLSAD